jgi:hypothetical protein
VVVDRLTIPVKEGGQRRGRREDERSDEPDLLDTPDVGVSGVDEGQESDGGEGSGSDESDVICE